MNDDLISRSRLLRDPYFREDRYPVSHHLRMAIMEQPAVDPVTVFKQIGLVKEAFEMAKADLVAVCRCKDCKCGKPPDSTRMVGKYVNCALYDPMPLMRSDDFCSYGERRADK